MENTIKDKKDKIIWLDDEILVQQFGLYQPQYDFASALETTISVDNNSFVLKEYEFTINEPYAELPDKTDYLNVMCDGYQENVFLTEIAFDAGSTTLSLHSPKIKLV